MIRDESNATYHANEAISHSKAETFRRRPALFFKKYVSKEIVAPVPTAAFRFGSASHTRVLEPKTWSDRYAVRPEGIDRRTKDGKEKYAAFEIEANGKTIIEAEEAAQVDKLAEAVLSHPIAGALLNAGEPELTWRKGSGRMALQCRTDWFNADGCELSEGRPYVVDLKTVESLDSDSFGNFERAVFKWGYHRQAGFYLPLITEILNKPIFDFFFIAAEKSEPYGVAVYRLTDDAVARGQDETLTDLRGIKFCYETGEWPNIKPTVRELGLPTCYEKGES